MNRYALKELSFHRVNDENGREKVVKAFKKELSIFNQLNHPNVVAIKGYFFSEGTIKILMPIYDCSLLQIVKEKRPFNEQQIKGFISQILAGLEHLHEKKIAHRLEVLFVFGNT